MRGGAREGPPLSDGSRSDKTEMGEDWGYRALPFSAHDVVKASIG